MQSFDRSSIGNEQLRAMSAKSGNGIQSGRINEEYPYAKPVKLGGVGRSVGCRTEVVGRELRTCVEVFPVTAFLQWLAGGSSQVLAKCLWIFSLLTLVLFGLNGFGMIVSSFVLDAEKQAQFGGVTMGTAILVVTAVMTRALYILRELPDVNYHLHRSMLVPFTRYYVIAVAMIVVRVPGAWLALLISLANQVIEAVSDIGVFTGEKVLVQMNVQNRMFILLTPVVAWNVLCCYYTHDLAWGAFFAGYWVNLSIWLVIVKIAHFLKRNSDDVKSYSGMTLADKRFVEHFSHAMGLQFSSVKVADLRKILTYDHLNFKTQAFDTKIWALYGDAVISAVMRREYAVMQRRTLGGVSNLMQRTTSNENFALVMGRVLYHGEFLTGVPTHLPTKARADMLEAVIGLWYESKKDVLCRDNELCDWAKKVLIPASGIQVCDGKIIDSSCV